MHGLDYETPVIPQTVPDDIELHFFNPLTCYLLDALSKGQSMGKLAVDPTKGTTIKSLMSARFPGIPATNDLPTCRVLSFHTIGYVQALCFHSLTYIAPKKTLQSRASAFCRTFVEDITASASCRVCITQYLVVFVVLCSIDQYYVFKLRSIW